MMFSGRFQGSKMLVPSRQANGFQNTRNASETERLSRKKFQKKALVCLIALATIFSLWFDEEVTRSLARKLSISFGDGTCEYVPAIQHYDEGFPTGTLHKTLIAGYPSGDKRLAFLQLEALTGLSARDEWDFLFLGATNQPFIKANYPHHEGIWGWGDRADQVVLIVSDPARVLIEYHDILWDIGYAQTWEEAYERIENLYKETEEAGNEHPPVADFLVWRDLRVFDEVHWWSWMIEYYMEGGLMRDMFTHELTVPAQWMMSILPNFFTKFEVRHGRFVDNSTSLDPGYDKMCATIEKGCYPILVIDPELLVDPDYGVAEARKLALVVNGTEGFDEWMIEESAWECLWNELIINKKGLTTFHEKNVPYDDYQFSFEMKNEIYHQITRLIEKFQVKTDQVSIDLVNILGKHRARLGVTTPTDPLTYEELMGYHLAFPPFFPNQKMFKSDDDFYVNVFEKYTNPDLENVEDIIARRRAFFEAEMERKRKRKVQIKYYDATGWTSLPAGGLESLTPYKTSNTTKIFYTNKQGTFADSERTNYVAALFQSYLLIDPIIEELCVTSDDGSKLYLDGVLLIDNDGLHADRKICAPVTMGVYKVDLEYFEAAGHATLVLEMGDSTNGLRVVPPRSWADEESQVRYRELLRLEEILEEDLRTLKETDVMGPKTRAEFNRRKLLREGGGQDRHLKKFDFSKMDQVLFQRKLEQMQAMKKNLKQK